MNRVRLLFKIKIKPYDVLFGIVSIFLFAYIISTLTNTGVLFYIVRSSSMKPVTVAGDIAVVKIPSNKTKIQPGDIVAFKSPKNEKDIYIHRIIEITSAGFITKGDANEDQDALPVRSDRVLGVYLFRIPIAGFFFEGLKRVIFFLFRDSYIGWALLLIIPTLYLLYARKRRASSNNPESLEGDS